MLILAADHAGYTLKEAVKKHLIEKDIPFLDCGTDNAAERVDYPLYAKKALDAMTDKENDRLFLFCGTGLGMVLCANRVNGIRAVCANDSYTAARSRSHNNANVLCFGGRVIGEGIAKDICDIFLTTKFEGERHAKRLAEIEELFPK